MIDQNGYDIKAKSVPFEGGTWDFLEMVAEGRTSENDLYAKVAATFQAVNKSARAVANMPFAIVKGKADYDVSDAWENKVGFMPNPKDLLRRVRQSLIMTNTAYLRMGKNVLRQPKKLRYVVPTSIKINTDDRTGELLNLQRIINGQIAQTFKPDDPDLTRFWWLDDKTELLPSPDTEFKAMMSASGIIFWSDFFTSNFYRNGGLKPTLIAMKGLVPKDKKEDEEKVWTKFLRGIAQSVANRVRVYNAETMDVKAFGDGLGDLKETPVYEQALANIAIALDMPLSLMLSNSANYATAQTEYIQWYRNSVVPWCEFIGDALTEQVFEPMGMRFEFRPENTDPEQEDEVSRTNALSGIGDALAKFPDADTFLGAAGVLGFELSDDFVAAVKAHYAKKEKQAEAVVVQTQTSDTSEQEEQPADDEQVDEEPLEAEPKAWTPTIDELNELRVWRDVALRRFKKGESLDFEYQPHYGGVAFGPAEIIRRGLPRCEDVEQVKALFNVPRGMIIKAETAAVQSDVLTLAAAINKLADAGGK
jgi:hypothetical protein